tara:strand:+ start:9709 stop:10203 length:495 start_codon:yes stop_codon:yes gene_type:complete
MEEVDKFIEECYKEKLISYKSFLLYLDELNFDLLQEKYNFFYLDEGKNIENIINQINMSSIIDIFNTDKKKKLLVIDGIAIYDKGFCTYINNILKSAKIKNIAIICEIYNINEINETLRMKCKTIYKKNHDIILPRKKFKTIKEYKEFLYNECLKNIYHSYNKE